jgi:hypothetical protein
MAGHRRNPWWQPNDADIGWTESLPEVIELKPDYGAERRGSG